MEPLQKQIIESFKKLDQFKYATWESSDFDEKISSQEVEEALKYHCPNQTFSKVFIQQMVELNGSGSVKICDYNHPYEITDIYRSMERLISGKLNHKPFTRSPYLANKNIFHIHHSQSFYSIMNCIRYFNKHYKKDSDILERLSQLKREHPNRNDHMVIFVNEVLLSSLNWPRKTGEWIVFQKIGTQIHFLCLYIHDYSDKDDKKLFSLIQEELKL